MVNDAINDHQRRKDMVELELYAQVLPSATALPVFVQIGPKVFPPAGLSCENKENCIGVVMTTEEFQELRDNSLVTMYKFPPRSPEMVKQLEELYKDGEPKEVFGAKFGRLDKTMIDQFPTVDRTWSPK